MNCKTYDVQDQLILSIHKRIIYQYTKIKIPEIWRLKKWSISIISNFIRNYTTTTVAHIYNYLLLQHLCLLNYHLKYGSQCMLEHSENWKNIDLSNHTVIWLYTFHESTCYALHCICYIKHNVAHSFKINTHVIIK